MNLESLKARVSNRIKSETLSDGEVVHIQKISPDQGLAFGNTLKASGHADPNSAEPPKSEVAEMYVQLLSRAIVEEVDGKWVASLDSEEGRAGLRLLEVGSLFTLGTIAHEWNGLSDFKKN
jgi:hypothetical protein